MKFCPKCGAILVPKKESGKYVYDCSCGYKVPVDQDAKITEEVKQKKEIEVVDEEVQTNPLVDETCPKCGHEKAYFWLEQTRSGDEAETKFFKCEKCKHIWRDYE